MVYSVYTLCCSQCGRQYHERDESVRYLRQLTRENGWSYTDDLLEAQVWKTKKGAMNKIKHSEILIKNPKTSGKPVEVEVETIIK